MKQKRPLFYLLTMAAVLVVGFFILETGARSWGKYGGPNNDYVYKVYNSTRTNVVMGDSHVGKTDWLGEEFVFLGNGGMSFFEQNRALQFYFRDREPGKIMIETGPQLFSRTHDKTWRTLPPGSLPDGPLAGRLYSLEPIFVQQIFNGVKDSLIGLISPNQANAQSKKTDREASRIARKLQNNGGHNFGYDAVPQWARERVIAQLTRQYLPQKDFEERIAWRSFVEMVSFLKEKGADICLVRVAVADEMEKEMRSAKKKPRNRLVRRAVSNLAKEQGIRFVDYVDLKARFGLDKFRNQDHLNANGARLYWETARRACFDNDTKARLTFENAALRDNVMANGSAAKGFTWWNLDVREGVEIEKSKQSYPLTVIKDRRALVVSSTNSEGEFALSKDVRLKGEMALVSSINAKVETQPSKSGMISMSIVYKDSSGAELKKDSINYKLDRVQLRSAQTANERLRWAGIVLRSNSPKNARTAKLEVSGSLDKGDTVFLDNFYMMSTGKVVDITKETKRAKRRSN